MTGSTNPQLLDSVQAPCVQYLKQLGFEHRGRTLNRETETGLIQVVNFQLGQRYLAGLFTINLGVFIQEIHDATSSVPISGLVSESSCEIRARIGRLMPVGHDHWWRLSEAQKLDSIAVGLTEKLPILQPFRSPDLSQNVLSSVQDYGLPFLERFAARSKIIEAWQRDQLREWMPPRAPLSIGIILAQQGETERARKLIRDYYTRVDKVGHRRFVMHVARSLGLEIEHDE
jgi:hypothetical protein